jgi:hypothetical protein
MEHQEYPQQRPCHYSFILACNVESCRQRNPMHICKTVFRIHDNSVWIPIWIRGSMPLTIGSGSCFLSLTFKMPTKNKFLNKFFCLLLFEGTFTSFFKDKKSKRSQNSRNQSFSYYFGLLIEGSGSGSGFIPLTKGFGSGWPKNM